MDLNRLYLPLCLLVQAMDELRRERSHWRDGPTLPSRIATAAAREQELAETYTTTSQKMSKLHEQIRCV